MRIDEIDQQLIEAIKQLPEEVLEDLLELILVMKKGDESLTYQAKKRFEQKYELMRED
jgi:hypothetical protein